MDRRSFLSSLPFIPAATRAVIGALASSASANPIIPVPLQYSDLNALFAQHVSEFQKQIYEHIAHNNPYAHLFDAHTEE